MYSPPLTRFLESITSIKLTPAHAQALSLAHLAAMGMKVDLADIPGDLPDSEGLIELMAQDKKVLDGKMRFILARGIGQAFVTSDVPRDVLKSVLDDALRSRQG